jgi:hypothetical protein
VARCDIMHLFDLDFFSVGCQTQTLFPLFQSSDTCTFLPLPNIPVFTSRDTLEMLVRSILARRSILPPHTWLHTSGARYLSLPTAVPPPPQQKSWLTKKVQQSPAALGIFLAVAKALGYGNPRQVAGRRAWALYEKLCAVRADEDRAFWKDGQFLVRLFSSPCVWDGR